MKTAPLASQKKVTFPRAKIRDAVQQIMPGNHTFQLSVSEAAGGDLKVVRVITEAWKRQWTGDRIARVLDAVNGKLTPEEQKSILRFSVLTPEEYKRLARWSPPKLDPRPKPTKPRPSSRKAA